MADENITVTGSTAAASYQQYLRTMSLVVGSSSTGQALDLSQLQVQFNITAASASTPRQLNCRVFNLSTATASKIEAEYNAISLSAGYQGHNGLLFQGTLQQKRHGRGAPTETYLDLFASDGYDVLAQAYINQTLAAGWTWADVYSQIIAAGAPDLKASSQPIPTTQKGARPLVMFGALRNVMQGLAENLGLKWQIDQGVLTFIPPSVADPGRTPDAAMVNSNTASAIVLSPSTGLIGIPAQTLDGIEAKCLLNSHIKPGRLVKIDTSLITTAKNDLSVSAVNPYPSISTDGIYRVMWTEHEGDTRGQPWYTNLVAESVDPTAATTIQQSAIEKAGFAGSY